MTDCAANREKFAKLCETDTIVHAFHMAYHRNAFDTYQGMLIGLVVALCEANKNHVQQRIIDELNKFKPQVWITGKVLQDTRVVDALRYVANGMGNLSLEQMGPAGVHGINDGKQRAIYLEEFVRIAREAIKDYDAVISSIMNSKGSQNDKVDQETAKV